MSLYSHNEEYPDILPSRIRLSDGSTRTSSETFTPEEIADAGYVGPIFKPDYDHLTEQLIWNGQEFSVSPIPAPIDGLYDAAPSI